MTVVDQFQKIMHPILILVLKLSEMLLFRKIAISKPLFSTNFSLSNLLNAPFSERLCCQIFLSPCFKIMSRIENNTDEKCAKIDAC